MNADRYRIEQRRIDNEPCPNCGGDRLRPDYTQGWSCHARRTPAADRDRSEEPCTDTRCDAQTHPAEDDVRLRVDIQYLNDRLADRRDDADRLGRALAVERARVARVEALCERWLNAETWEGKPAMVDRGFGNRLWLALNDATGGA